MVRACVLKKVKILSCLGIESELTNRGVNFIFGVLILWRTKSLTSDEVMDHRYLGLPEDQGILWTTMIPLLSMLYLYFE